MPAQCTRANGSRSDQFLLHFGQFGVQQAAVAGQEEVRKPELVDSLTLPGAPDLLSPGRRRLGVSFQDRHLVAIPAEQKSSTQADHPSTDNHDLGDGDSPPPPMTTREAYARPRFPRQAGSCTAAAGVGVDRQYAVFGAFGAITFMALSGCCWTGCAPPPSRAIPAARPATATA